MKKGLFHLVVSVVLFVISASTDSEVVWLKDVTTSFEIDKRTLSDPDLPDELTFHIYRGSAVLTLNLKRNHGIDPNADFYFVRKSKDGQSFLEKTANLEKEDVAYYQDRENGAFMTVRSIKRLNGQRERVINGNVRIHNTNYDLRAAESDVNSRNLLDVPDLLGTRYILRDQASIRRNIVSEKDATQLNEINFEQELRDYLRRFSHGQHNRNYFQPTNSALSSRYVSRLHNRDNNAKQTYWIEVAVLIDSGIWDFYTLLVPGEDKRKKVIQVKMKIKEAYSHIINGVNLLYNAIEDPHIDISVTLRAFHIFERKSDLARVHTETKTVNGKECIEAHNYLNHIIAWDRGMSKKPGTNYDHSMLFTRYDLYDRSPLNNSISGLALPGGVCDAGRRTSLIEMSDYFLTVSTAAHELGHNLGAVHDGEGNTIDCLAEDLFIMTLREPSFDPAKANSSNPWFFSNCSVKAFKETLRNKTCVTNEGVFFDQTLWRKYVKQQPGQVYSASQQCELINGPGSVLCGTETANICRFMKCLNPKTGKCIRKYFSAARGTTCGKKMAQRKFYILIPVEFTDNDGDRGVSVTFITDYVDTGNDGMKQYMDKQVAKCPHHQVCGALEDIVFPTLLYRIREKTQANVPPCIQDFSITFMSINTPSSSNNTLVKVLKVSFANYLFLAEFEISQHEVKPVYIDFKNTLTYIHIYIITYISILCLTIASFIPFQLDIRT